MSNCTQTKQHSQIEKLESFVPNLNVDLLRPNGKRKKASWATRKKWSLGLAEVYSALAFREMTPNLGLTEYCSHRLEMSEDEISEALDSFIMHNSMFGKKAMKVRNCSNYLDFRFGFDSDGKLIERKLNRASFCKDRLCPMCAWRRSQKNFYNACRVFNRLPSGLVPILLTVTVRSVEGDVLGRTLDRMNAALEQMLKVKRVSKCLKGGIKSVEVTFNSKKGSKAYKLYHPHIHLILLVSEDYFNSENYIPHAEWLAMWRKYYKDDAIKMVNVKRVKNLDLKDYEKSKEYVSFQKALKEVTKYSVKASNYLIPNDLGLSMKVVSDLQCLNHRRFISFFGVCKSIFAELQLEDAEKENADLINVDGEELNPALVYIVCRFKWSAGVYNLSSMVDLNGATDKDLDF